MIGFAGFAGYWGCYGSHRFYGLNRFENGTQKKGKRDFWDFDDRM